MPPRSLRWRGAARSRIAADIISPFIRSFRPELLLVSAGFDAHWNDPITSLGLSTRGFHELSSGLVDLASEFCGGKVVFVFEGGYDPENLANGIEACFAVLMGTAFSDPGDAAPHTEPDASARLEAVKKWNGF